MVEHFPGLFITLEGGEAAGKSTQLDYLKEKCARLGFDFIATREPGGTQEAEILRKLLLDPQHDWSGETEVLLHYAARFEHCQKLIWPALRAGKIVISDRFFDSTLAYQSYGFGVPAEWVNRLRRLTLGNFAPDVTIILDLPLEQAAQRLQQRQALTQVSPDRYEANARQFHERVQAGFRAIAEKERKRCHLMDATIPVAELRDKIWATIQGHIFFAQKRHNKAEIGN